MILWSSPTISGTLKILISTFSGPEDAKEADYYLNEHLPDIAIVDLGLPDEDGLSLIRRWRSHDVSLPVL